MSYNNYGTGNNRPQQFQQRGQQKTKEFIAVYDSLHEDLRPYLMAVQGGRPYFTVQGRMILFRRAHGDNGGIVSDAISINDKEAVFTTEVRLYGIHPESPSAYRVLGKATARETITGFADFIEKAETASIGRALLAAGFGIQYGTGTDMEEGRIRDTPIGEAIPEEEVHPSPAPVQAPAPAPTANIRSEPKPVNTPKPVENGPKEVKVYGGTIKAMTQEETAALSEEEKEDRKKALTQIISDLRDKGELQNPCSWKDENVKKTVYMAVSLALFADPHALDGLPDNENLWAASNRIAGFNKNFLRDVLVSEEQE